jgi:hypothetical protein
LHWHFLYQWEFVRFPNSCKWFINDKTYCTVEVTRTEILTARVSGRSSWFHFNLRSFHNILCSTGLLMRNLPRLPDDKLASLSFTWKFLYFTFIVDIHFYDLDNSGLVVFSSNSNKGFHFLLSSATSEEKSVVTHSCYIY